MTNVALWELRMQLVDAPCAADGQRLLEPQSLEEIRDQFLNGATHMENVAKHHEEQALIARAAAETFMAAARKLGPVN